MVSRLRWAAPAALVAILLVAFLVTFDRPFTEAQALKYNPDSWDYLYGAVSILHGQYLVDWGGGAPRVPMYPPGLPLLLAPLVVLSGGMQGGLWLSSAAAIVLGLGAAAIAARISGRGAAPLAVALVIFTPSVILQARLVMSDLPSAGMALLEVVLLALIRRKWALFAAGLLAGVLIWIRYANVGLVPAGLVALTALSPTWRGRAVNAAWYCAGVIPLVLVLAAWQYATFGSPLITTYQVMPVSISRIDEFGSFFAARFVLGQPFNRDGRELAGLARTLGLPNLFIYPLQLLGGDSYLLLPGVGAIGLFALVRYARRDGTAGVLGRFGLTAVITTLVIYLPYYYQTARFFQLPAALEGLAAAALISEWGLVWSRRVRTRFDTRRRTQSSSAVA